MRVEAELIGDCTAIVKVREQILLDELRGS